MPSMRQGLTELAIVAAILALLATGGSLRYRREIRAFFGVEAAPAAAGAPARPLPLPAPPR
jgi:hypothetical protein